MRYLNSKMDENDYMDLVENASDMIQCVENSGRFLYVNQAWKNMLGYSDGEWENLSLWDIIHPDYINHCNKMFKQVLSGCKIESVETVLITKNKQFIYAEGSVNCRFDDKGNVISTQGIFRDVSSYKTLIEELKIKTNEAKKYKINIDNRIKLQSLFTKSICRFIDVRFDEVPKAIYQTLADFGKQVKADRVYIFKYLFDESVCKNTYVWCSERIKSQINQLQNVDMKMMSEWVDAHVKGESIIISNMQEKNSQNEITRLIESQGIKSLIAVPMMRKGTCYGFIGFDSASEYNRYSEFEQDILKQLSAVIINTISRVEIEKEFIRSEYLKAAFIDSMQELIFAIDNDLIIRGCYCSESDLLYLELDKFLGKHIGEIGFPQPALCIIKAAMLDVFKTQKPARVEYYLDLPQGRCWFDAYISLMMEGFSVEGLTCVVRDITERKKMEKQLEEKEKLLSSVLNMQKEMICRFLPDTTLIYVNPAYCRFIGKTKEQILGKKLFHFISRVQYQKVMDSLSKLGEEKDATSYDYQFLGDKGRIIWQEWTDYAIKNSNQEIIEYQSVGLDVTEKNEKQQQIEYLSYHDHLTGMYNRYYFEDCLKKIDIKGNLPLALMVVDVNGLKLTNDAFGHQVGNQLLIKVADILKSSCRSYDVISRIGGDEFGIILFNINEEQAEKVKKRILENASKQKFDSIVISLAIGYALKREKDETVEELIRNADNQMHRNKAKTGKIMRSQTIETVLRSINSKYDNEQLHTERVAQYCEAIGEALGLDEKEICNLKTAGILHDIGKIMVPPEILSKVDNLCLEEIETIRRHPETGYQILQSVDEYTKALAKWVLYHHERYDGTGYPQGLKGENIPFESRIIAVADSFEAMTAQRPYQKTKTKEEALAEIKRCSGTQFDPGIVEVFLSLME